MHDRRRRRAPTTPATRSISPSAPPRSAPTRCCHVNPYYNRPEPARNRPPLRGGLPRHRPADPALQHPAADRVGHAQRPAGRARPARQHLRGQAGQRRRTWPRSTAFRSTPATTTCSPTCSTSASPAGSSSPATCSARRCTGWSTSPTTGARSTPGLKDVYADMPVAPLACATKAALHLLGLLPYATPRLPYVELDDRELEVIRAMLERHGLLQAAGRDRHAPRPAARRPGRDRQEHDRRRVRRADRRRRHRAAVPDHRHARDRSGAARLRVPARPRGRHRGDRDHSRPRGPPRGAAVGAARARRLPARVRRPADGRDGALQARRAQAARRPARGPAARRAARARPVRARARAHDPLDPRLVRGRAHDRARHRAC